MMADYWFKPKVYGHGASPANWKGWAAIAGFVIFELALLWPWLLAPVLAGEEPTAAGLAATIALFVGSVIGFIWLCKIKTDGTWAWRWGDKP